ncbi:MAG: hypothetical protein HKL80_01680 [Acidimicrobiales bacterium]|nr:hypothetical protein [Acidimicrobiales bacterium]
MELDSQGLEQGLSADKSASPLDSGEPNVTNDFHSGPSSPPSSGRRVALRPIAPGDIPFLYGISTAVTSSFHWRLRGSTPSPENFTNQLWSDVLSQYIVFRKDTGEQLGLVVCHNANFIDGVAYLAALASPRYIGSGAMAEGAALFLEGIFKNWNFRKIYLEAPEFNVLRIQSGLKSFFHEEGRLKAHHFYNGQYHDQLLLAIYREEFNQLSPFIRVALGVDTEDTLPEGSSLRNWGSAEDILGLDQFCQLVSNEFDRPLDWVVPEAHLYDDLGFDSLDMIVLTVLLDEMTGQANTASYDRFTTVRETWLYYCEFSSRPTI